MSHSTNPPIEIDGPDHPSAFIGIPIDRRPDIPCTMCPTCRGHGAWNTRLWEGGRCIIKPCPDCDGSGWVANDGRRHVADIVMIDGRPTWVTAILPRTIVQRTVPMPEPAGRDVDVPAEAGPSDDRSAGT